MFKRLDRYILTHFFSNLIFCLTAFLIIFIVVDIIDHLDKFIDANMPGNAILWYYLHTLPWFISIGLPMALLLSTVFTMSILQKNNELTALKASGLSIKRVSISLLIFGVLFSLMSFQFDNSIVTSSFQIRSQLEEEYGLIKSSYKKIRKRDIYRQIDKNRILSIKRFQFSNQIAHRVSLQYFDGQNIQHRFDTVKMKWDNKLEQWVTQKYTIRSWKNDSISFYSSIKDTSLSLGLKPIDLMQETGRPEEMNYHDLLQFVTRLEENGIHEPRWAVNLHFKTAFAATNLLMVLFGLSLSIRKPHSSLAVGVGLSICVIFMYYAALKFGQSLGYNGILSPFWSVWWANIVFLGMGSYLYFKTRS